MYDYFEVVWAMLRARFEGLRRNPEAGYTTEFVVITALVIMIAIAVLAILAPKIIAKATSITL